MDRWRGKVAVVTGASAGIGAATAITLVKQGIQVIGVARREEHVQALQEQVVGAPGKLIPRKADVSKQQDIEELFNWVKETFGTIHILVNNAGIIRYGRLLDQNPKYWQDTLNTNVMGLAICTQQAIKLMKDSGVDDGHIIHINSLYISPGIVKTDICDASNAAVLESERIDRTALIGGRPELESQDIADAVVYVLGTPPRVQIHELTIKPVGENI